jgi:hypothetical protein
MADANSAAVSIETQEGQDRCSAANSPQRILPEDSGAPSLRETLALVIFSYAVFYLALFFWNGLRLVGGDQFGDNPAYLELATAIREWRFAAISAHQFWGASYATAAFSLVTRVPLRASLVIVCVVSSLIGVVLCHRLWNAWIAVFFASLSLDWFQRSLLGGSESLFVALVLVAFWFVRRERWKPSALFGSLATVVRPYGLFMLIGLGVQLLWQKKFKECLYATLIALLIGGAYAWPLAHYLGNPFANVSAYRQSDWHGEFPYTIPFVTIIRDTFGTPAPLTSIVLTSLWAGLIVAGIGVAVIDGDLRRYARAHLAEACFVCIFCMALVTYNSREWARTDFPRFALPVLPWILVFLYRYLPKKRVVVWSLAVITPVLAAASALGIRNVPGMIAKHFH